MLKCGYKILLSCIVIGFLPAANVFAGDLEWSGLYRIEGNHLMNPSLDNGRDKSKTYAIHTLMLRPRIVAADSLFLTGQFNLFNSDKYNQMGAVFGDGLEDDDPSTETTSVNDSNTLSETGKNRALKVSQFYLTHVQEYGQLIVGRAPLHFGLGITHNAGAGLFDHFSDIRDMVAYKAVMGNFFIMPSFAKIDEGGLSNYDDIAEINVHVEYQNSDADSSMGVMYTNRRASQAGNDTPADAISDDGNSALRGYESKSVNVFFKKMAEKFSIGFELAQRSGKAGVIDSTGANVSLSGFGVAFELEWHNPQSKYVFGLKTGLATGDDPATEDEFEGFIFDRNYDVAVLLFNHMMGKVDVFQTRVMGRDDNPDVLSTSEREPDIEALSNVTYVSPYVRKKWSDKWTTTGVFTMAWLDTTKVRDPDTTLTNNYTVDDSVGYEIDLSLDYQITEKILWSNQVAYFSPGDAWTGGSLNFDNDDFYAFFTKAAVSF